MTLSYILIAELNIILFSHQSWVFGRGVWRNPLWSLNLFKKMNILIAELNTISFAHQSWIFGREVWRNPLWSLNPAKVCSLASSPLMPRAIQKGNAKYQTANVNNVLFPCKPWICWNIGFHAVFYMKIVNITGQLSYFIEESWNVQKSDSSLIQNVHLGATNSGNPQHVPPETLFGGRIMYQPSVVIFIKWKI